MILEGEIDNCKTIELYHFTSKELSFLPIIVIPIVATAAIYGVEIVPA